MFKAKFQVPISQKPQKHFRPAKACLVYLYLKTGKCIIMLETSHLEETSVHI